MSVVAAVVVAVIQWKRRIVVVIIITIMAWFGKQFHFIVHPILYSTSISSSSSTASPPILAMQRLITCTLVPWVLQIVEQSSSSSSTSSMTWNGHSPVSNADNDFYTMLPWLWKRRYRQAFIVTTNPLNLPSHVRHHLCRHRHYFLCTSCLYDRIASSYLHVIFNVWMENGIHPPPRLPRYHRHSPSHHPPFIIPMQCKKHGVVPVIWHGNLQWHLIDSKILPLL